VGAGEKNTVRPGEALQKPPLRKWGGGKVKDKGKREGGRGRKWTGGGGAGGPGGGKEVMLKMTFGGGGQKGLVMIAAAWPLAGIKHLGTKKKLCEGKGNSAA